MAQLIIIPCPSLRTDPESFIMIATHKRDMESMAQTLIILPKIVPSCSAAS